VRASAVQICQRSGGERLAALLLHPAHPSVCWQPAQGKLPALRPHIFTKCELQHSHLNNTKMR
jgi:hypothetical protein